MTSLEATGQNDEKSKEAKIDGSQLYVKAAAKPTLKAPTFDVKVSATVSQNRRPLLLLLLFGW